MIYTKETYLELGNYKTYDQNTPVLTFDEFMELHTRVE